MHNALLVRWSGGWAEVHDDTSVAAHGRHEALLGIGAVASLAEVNRVAAEQLAIFANPRTEISADLVAVDDTDRPYIAFGPSDTVLVPDIDGTVAREQVVALTVAEDENGTVTFAPELKDVILTDQERWEQGLKKMSDGTIRGQSAVATPAAQVPSTAVAAGGGAGATGYEAVFTLPGAAVPQYSPPIVTPRDCTLSAVVVTVRTVAATFTVDLLKDDVVVFSEGVGAAAHLTVFDGLTTASIADTSMWVVHVYGTSVTTADIDVTLRFALI